MHFYFVFVVVQSMYWIDMRYNNQMGNTENELSAKPILDLGFSFWPSKILLSAVGFELFTILAKNKKMSGKEIAGVLGFKCIDRHVYDYLDTLVAIGMLAREGVLQSSVYSNSLNADHFLDKAKPTYVGGILEMLNVRLYMMWGSLEQSLKTGQPYFQNHSNGVNPFEVLYNNPEMLKGFVNAMGGMQVGSSIEFAKKFDFSKYETLVDAGGSGGELSMEVAKHHPHMKCINFDLPPVEPIAKENIEKYGLTARVTTASGDFFKQDLPKADVVVMGMILHDWDMSEKELLIKRAYDAVLPGGAFVALEHIIDDQRKKSYFALSMSINMLIETKGGFDFSFEEFDKWTKAAGFKSTSLIELSGNKFAAVAYK